MYSEHTSGYRPIRSFAKREGRLTPGQQKRLDTLWPIYGVDDARSQADWAAIFGRTAPITLEIGFGAGEVLATRAQAEPERDFIGIEVYRTGIARLMGALHDSGALNARVLYGDAFHLIDAAFDPGELDEVLLYFPDPWPKKRHHKRRLVTTRFADSVARVLKLGGVWRLATDWTDYAEWMREVIDPHPAFDNIGDVRGFDSSPPRPATRFEARGEHHGHTVRDLIYRRKTGP